MRGAAGQRRLQHVRHLALVRLALHAHNAALWPRRRHGGAEGCGAAGAGPPGHVTAQRNLTARGAWAQRVSNAAGQLQRPNALRVGSFLENTSSWGVKLTSAARWTLTSATVKLTT